MSRKLVCPTAELRVALRQSFWISEFQQLGCNPLWAPPALRLGKYATGCPASGIGINSYVPRLATVKVLEVKQCDSLVTLPNLAQPLAMTLALWLGPQSLIAARKKNTHLPAFQTLWLDPRGPSCRSHLQKATSSRRCVPGWIRWDRQDSRIRFWGNFKTDSMQGGGGVHKALHIEGAAEGWSTDVTSWFLPTSYTPTAVDCLATTLGGAYAGIYLPVPLATTTSSSTRTASVTSSTTVTSTTTTAVASDTGMVVGTSVASIAFVIVIGLCAWQAYAGNVNLKVNVPDAKASCKWMAESVKTAKVKVRPWEKPPSEPLYAWEGGEPSLPGQADEVKHAHRDAEEHFWDWARDVANSASKPEASLGRSFGFGGPVPGTPPTIPRPHFPLATQSDEKEEYFQSFAQELNDIIGSGMPNMIADTPSMPKTPPPPPPKRNQIAEITPPSAPWSQRRPSLYSSSTTPLPPPPLLENAERVDVRVDQSFSDWASDFALCTPPSPTEAKGVPPPPPPSRPATSALPLPPPRPPGSTLSSRPQMPLPLATVHEQDPHEWNQLANRPGFAIHAVPCLHALHHFAVEWLLLGFGWLS